MWIWVVSNIAGSLLGAASTRWVKDTKVGIWGYKKFEDIARRTQYPNIAKKLDSLEQRLHKLESKK